MGLDARLRRPNPIVRSGSLVYTYVEFYGTTITVQSELRAYTSTGQLMSHPFTDADSIQSTTSSGTYTPSGIQTKTIALLWIFDSATVAAQAATLHVGLWYNSILLDYY
jgi:hypothetical protein